jgi:hypothetical protein
MRHVPRARAFVRALAAVGAITALVSTACSSGNGASARNVGALVGFDETAASNANSPIITADPFFACGSQTATFGTELLNTSPKLAKVRFEWGDIEPGKQMYEVGTASSVVVGHGGDLPFTHPFGDDETFNVRLDAPFAGLSQKVGTDSTDIPAGSLHTEIAEGLLPHDASGNIQPSFLVRDGDRLAAYGRWILDCGHGDFHTEIHPPTYAVWGHSSGSTTTASAWYNPYDVTQTFNPNTSLTTDFSSSARFSDPLTQPFPLYLYQQLLRLAGVGPDGTCCADRLEAHSLIAPNDSVRHASWYVCAPKGGAGSLSVRYRFTVRPGVSITATPVDSIGCVRFQADLGAAYAPMVPQRQDCALDWNTLTLQAEEATGNPNLDVKAAIIAQAPSLAGKVGQPPIIDCYPPPAAPPPGGSTGQKVFVSGSQPFPFYGTIEVAWKG